MNTSARQFELMAMQSLLPGLTFSAEKCIENLNEARGTLGMPPMRLRVEGGTPPILSGETSTVRPMLTALREVGVKIDRRKGKGKRHMSPEVKAKVGAATRERWAIVKAAGISTNGKLPSHRDIDKAHKILAKRAATA